MIYKKIGKKQEAETAFKRAIMINPRIRTLISQFNRQT
jgi:hypothetical protein